MRIETILPLLLLTCSTHKISDSVNYEKSIREILVQFELAFEKRDASLYADNFTKDAEWENAFGNREIGRENIETRIRGVYQMFQQANQKVKEIRIRFITSDVAVADVDREITGQVNEGNDKTLPKRNVRTTHVFKRTNNSTWKVIIFRVADLRNPQEMK